MDKLAQYPAKASAWENSARSEMAEHEENELEWALDAAEQAQVNDDFNRQWSTNIKKNKRESIKYNDNLIGCLGFIGTDAVIAAVSIASNGVHETRAGLFMGSVFLGAIYCGVKSNLEHRRIQKISKPAQ